LYTVKKSWNVALKHVKPMCVCVRLLKKQHEFALNNKISNQVTCDEFMELTCLF